jgi:hypothetical protein
MEFNGRVIEGFKYKTLNDARVYEPILAEGNGKVNIWHLKSFDKELQNNHDDLDIMRDLRFGLDEYTIPALEKALTFGTSTMVGFKKYWEKLGTINLPNKSLKHRTQLEYLEDVYRAMQGEFWSPYGEALKLTQEKLVHTSMSIGDIISVNYTTDKKINIRNFIVADTGFKEIIVEKQTHKITLKEMDL